MKARSTDCREYPQIVRPVADPLRLRRLARPPPSAALITSPSAALEISDRIKSRVVLCFWVVCFCLSVLFGVGGPGGGGGLGV